MSLKEYKNKRDFSSTSEPKGKVEKTKFNRFVIQYHKARAIHYDFRLEYNGVLLSWAVPKGLSSSPKVKRLAVHVEDHPLDYISFEGTIPKGNYGAGTVEIYDKGNYVPINDISKGLKDGVIKFVLKGEKINGGYSLIKTDEKNWLIVKLEDEFVEEEKIKEKKIKMPKAIEPQLATLTKTLPTGNDWVYEIKYDGYRMITYKNKEKVKIVSRNNIDYTKKFTSIVDSLKKIEGDFIIDGEVVSFDENGRSDFSLLQTNMKSNSNNLYYVVFDLLFLDGLDLRNLELLERKEKLERLLYKSKNNIIYSKHVKNGKETFQFAKKHNLEGIIAKNIASTYSGKRNKDWLKIKCAFRQEFVIGGYTTTSKNKILSALLLGYYQKNKLIYVGKVGTGFTESRKKELHELFLKYEINKNPFEKEFKGEINYLKPKLVCEVQFTELTKENILRQPSFIGLREDKNPKDVLLESKNEK